LKRKSENIRDKLLPAGTFCLILLIWWGLSAVKLIPNYMLPSPLDVGKAFVSDFPNLMRHALISLEEAAAGLAIGTLLPAVFATASSTALISTDASPK
jgi:ABC-type nitrate/sulfonate/bicarbonate transport system permease component